MSYAIISLGGKQYRVSEGETLLVDRLREDEGATVALSPMLVGGDGDPQLTPDGVTVTARVVKHVLGEKIRIGKYRPKSGYRRHNGYRSRLSQIQIETIGRQRSAAARKSTEAPPDAAPKGLPKGYADMTVAEVGEGAPTWNRPMLEAALEYERAHADRKGAIAALESAIAAKEES